MIAEVRAGLGEVRELCAKYRVTRLELFGSATSAAFDPASSDLDFIVEFADISPVEHADCYFGLLMDLQTLFGRDVDLLELRPDANPFLLTTIEESRETLYAA